MMHGPAADQAETPSIATGHTPVALLGRALGFRHEEELLDRRRRLRRGQTARIVGHRNAEPPEARGVVPRELEREL